MHRIPLLLYVLVIALSLHRGCKLHRYIMTCLRLCWYRWRFITFMFKCFLCFVSRHTTIKCRIRKFISNWSLSLLLQTYDIHLILGHFLRFCHVFLILYFYTTSPVCASLNMIKVYKCQSELSGGIYVTSAMYSEYETHKGQSFF